MVRKDSFCLLLCIFILSAFIFVYPAFAEIKVFEKETTWKAAKNQSQEQSRVRELQVQFANLKSFDVKRLEELNTQALALERERDRQRLVREEQALKAKGELSRADACYHR